MAKNKKKEKDTKREWLSIELVIAASIILGFLLPYLSAYIYQYIIYLILIMMFLTFLAVDLKETFSVKVLVLWFISNILILPFIGYIFSLFVIKEEFRLGVLLITLAPAAIMNSFYVSLVGGNKLQAAAISVLSNLLAIIVIPLLLFIYTGKYIAINYLSLILSLIYVILVPFIISMVFRRLSFLSFAAKAVSDKTAIITKILLFVLLYAMIGVNSASLLKTDIVSVIAISSLLTALSFVAGYFSGIFSKLNRQEKNTLMISTGIRNNALMIGIISSSFAPLVALPIIVNIITHQVINVILIRLHKKNII